MMDAIAKEPPSSLKEPAEIEALIGLFHFISIQGVDELFLNENFRIFPGGCVEIVLLSQGLEDQLHLYFFFPDEKVIILVIFLFLCL